jgi:hypothetical protein
MSKIILKKISGYILLIGIIALLLIFFSYLDSQKKSRFKQEPCCYTKSFFLKYYYNYDTSGESVIYKFKVGQFFFEASVYIDDKTKYKIRDTMTVRYLCKEPEVNEIVLDEK